jgi:predicted HicB family RNase H-like nuclease
MTTELKNLQVRIPEELHTWLRMEAIRQRTTVRELIIRTLMDMKESK